MMIDSHRQAQFDAYNRVRARLAADPNILVRLEKLLTDFVVKLLEKHKEEIRRDFNEASYLFPFWQNYPPDDRGRQPMGDQYPWIEVGEHAIGSKLPRMLASEFAIRDTGLPTGPDERFVVEHPEILKITGGLTSAAWLFVDIKSVGPRDDADHTVMSHNQISGDGLWVKLEDGVRNQVLKAKGAYREHDFHCSIPPLFILSDGTVAPTVIVVIKPVYSMEKVGKYGRNGGQPISRVDVASIPNGLLLLENPAFLKKFPGLLFPGKDDKSKNPLKVRARVSFPILRQLGVWRLQTVKF